jgi:hypothetical protein
MVAQAAVLESAGGALLVGGGDHCWDGVRW